MNSITRRQLLAGSVSGLGALAVSPLLAAVAAAKDQGAPFKIGACDWSIGNTQKPEAFAVAKEIGLDGVEVSFSQPGSATTCATSRFGPSTARFAKRRAWRFRRWRWAC